MVNKPLLPTSLRLFGILSLICVVVLWTLSNYSTQHVMRKYSKVFFLNIMYTASLQVYFLFWVYGDPIKTLRSKYADGDEAEEDVEDSSRPVEVKKKESQELLSFREHAVISIPFAVLYIAGNVAMIEAFSRTSPFAASLMACTSSLFTLAFGRLFGVDKVSGMKACSVLITIAAVAYYNWYDLAEEKELAKMTWTGNGLGVLSAAFYGAYSVYLKVACKDSAKLSYSLLFAFAGFYTTVFMVPAVLCLDFFSIEKFELPTFKIGTLILANAVFGSVIPNYLWNAAFLFTSPLSVAIGLSFMTPLSLFVEWLRQESVIQYYHILATFFMMIGFLLINLADIYKQYDIELF